MGELQKSRPPKTLHPVLPLGEEVGVAGAGEAAVEVAEAAPYPRLPSELPKTPEPGASPSFLKIPPLIQPRPVASKPNHHLLPLKPLRRLSRPRLKPFAVALALPSAPTPRLGPGKAKD